MTIVKQFFTENWRGKLVSLLVAFSIWYVIKSHLDSQNQSFPVPGTGPTTTVRPPSSTGIEESLLGPLAPPVPGNAAKE